LPNRDIKLRWLVMMIINEMEYPSLFLDREKEDEAE
jgi:hypothetical protein